MLKFSANMNEREESETEGLTRKEEVMFYELLSKCKGKFSAEIYTEIARIVPQHIVEVVLFRMSDGVLETLLIPRPKDDIVWPGMVHTPGSALRTADFERADGNPVNEAFERIQKGELQAEFSETPVFAARMFRKGDRGPEVVEVYIAKLKEDTELGNHQEWFPVDELSKNPRFIQGQLGHIKLAAEEFFKQNS